MTTRSRTRSSYTARAQRRTAAPRRRKRSPAWVSGPHLPALLAVAAELGHLAAALVEWPGGWVRGLVHVLVAAGLGLLAVGVYFGPYRRVPAVAVALALPAAWSVGAIAGLPPYADFPVLGAIALTTTELVIAGMLVARRS